MDALDSLLMFLGSSICHQLAERSYSFGDMRMPLCARCIGIHVSFLISMMFMWTGERRFASSLPWRNSRSPITGPRDWLWPALIYAFGAAVILSSESAYAVFLAVSIAGVAGVFVFFSPIILVLLSLSFEDWKPGPGVRGTASVVLV